jgi:hypothetical protein
LQESATLYKDSADFFVHMQSLAKLSESGEVYLSKADAKTYYNLKVLAAEYDHNNVENVNNDIFDVLVKMIYNLYENI